MPPRGTAGIRSCTDRCTERDGPYPDVPLRIGTGWGRGTEFSIRIGVRTSTDGPEAIRLPQCASTHLIAWRVVPASCLRGIEGNNVAGCPPSSQSTRTRPAPAPGLRHLYLRTHSDLRRRPDPGADADRIGRARALDRPDAGGNTGTI